MKKKILYIAILAVTLFTASCSTNDEVKPKKQESNEKSTEIIRCFDEKDIEGLKKLFCENSQENHDLDEEIQAAFDLYEGKSESYDLNYGGTAGGWEDGECIDEHITPSIKNIRTTSEKEYSIFYTEYTICDYDKKKIGIIYLSLFDENDIPLARISWPKEYNDLYG